MLQQQHDMEVFLQQLLLDPNSPISDRWRALFTLRNLKGDGPRQALIKGRSVGRPVCVCVRFSIFILCCRPPRFSFLRVSRILVCFHGRLMERFSLEVLVCCIFASCLSLFGFLGFFLGFTFWRRGSGSRELNLMVCLVVRGFVAMSDASNLLAHEAAFALGQMQDVAAIPALCTVLQDTSSFHPIVRHEVRKYVPPANFFVG